MSEDVVQFPGTLSEKFLAHANSPKNVGTVDNPSGAATGVGVCGDSVDVTLQVDGERITDIKCYPHGCVHTLVCASAMSELAKGRTIEQALELNPDDVETALGGLPENHTHCARLAVNTLGEAIEDFYRKARLKAAG